MCALGLLDAFEHVLPWICNFKRFAGFYDLCIVQKLWVCTRANMNHSVHATRRLMESQKIPKVGPPGRFASSTDFNTHLHSMLKSLSLAEVLLEAILPRPFQGKGLTLCCLRLPIFLGNAPVSGVQASSLTIIPCCRYHIGESLIPSVRHYLRFIDAEQKLVDVGFKHKVWQEASSSYRVQMILITTKQPGAAIKFNQFKREGCRP